MPERTKAELLLLAENIRSIADELQSPDARKMALVYAEKLEAEAALIRLPMPRR